MSKPLSIKVDLSLPLESFTLEFHETLGARVTGLFGPSGCGKTSLVETIAGLRRNANGKIVFGDTVWQDSASGIFIPPERRGIGYVPQNGLLFPHLTVKQNLLFGSKRAREGDDCFDQVVEILQLAPLLARKPLSLSGGERQRVAAGRAVCSGPQLLILDEPLSALDLTLRHSTLAFFARLVREFQLSMLWVSHDAVEVQAICDELVAMDNGKVKQRGEPRQVLTDPEIFPAFELSGFQNVLRCQVVTSTAAQTIVRLDGGSTELTLSSSGIKESPRPDTSAMVTIPARSILIATANPSHVSAGNILQGLIDHIEPLTGGIALAHVHLADQGNLEPLVVEVTAAACDRLDLRAGQSIYVLIKSTACVLQTTGQEPPTNQG